MSERNQAPRSGGRTADQRSRDADAQRHAGAEVGRADTRRSGMGRDRGMSTRGRGQETGLPRSRRDDAAPVRREARDAAATGRPRDTDRARLRPRDTDGLRIKPRATRDTDGVRVRARDTETPRLKKRDTDGLRAKARDTDGLRAKARDTDGLRAKAREADGARLRVRGHANDTDGSRVGARNGASGRGLNGGRPGAPAVRDRKASMSRGRMADALSGRRRAYDADAPVDGTAALQVEVGLPAEGQSDLPKPPRLRVAPPAPISVPRAPFVAGVLGVVVVGVLGILLINTKTNENSFRIADLEKQNAVLDNKKQDLDNQLVQASSIGNLDAAARRLGMVKADTDKLALFKLPDGKVIGVPTPTGGKVAVTAQDPKAGDSGDKDAPAKNGAATQPPASGQPALGAGQTGQVVPGQPTLGTGQILPGQTGQGTTSQDQTAPGQSGQGQPSGTGQ
jgi:hypothetical protein